MQLAHIRALDCVGCGKCLGACPVDAIVGGPQFLHIILIDECIGCGLCVDPCPMDCIDLIQSPQAEEPNFKTALAHQARIRHQAKQQRLLQSQAPQLPLPQDPETRQKIKNDIEEAIARVNQKKNLCKQSISES